MDKLILVNKDNLFDDRLLNEIELYDYITFDDRDIRIERETFEAFKQLQSHLRVDGIEIELDEGYRSLEAQENIMLDYIRRYGEDYALSIVAMPGTSEHHTGMAIDVVIKKDGKFITENADLLKEKEIFEKIHHDLKYFGFILRYPEGKEDITGYSYEPWHFRYVGIENADKIGELTLEEFWEKYGEKQRY
jgi:D-alanyl-D-alanine carboxypeptidase